MTIWRIKYTSELTGKTTLGVYRFFLARESAQKEADRLATIARKAHRPVNIEVVS